MKFRDYQTNPSLGKMLTVAMTLALVVAPLSTSYARPDVPPGKVSTPVYDYRDFMGPHVTQRVYRINGGEGFLIQTVEQLTEDEWRIDNAWSDNQGATTARSRWYYRMTDTDFLHHGNERLDLDGNLLFAEDFDPPLSMLQSVMPQGAEQGGATVVTRYPEGNIYGGTRSNTALGLDNVGWANGTFNDCLSSLEEGNGQHRVSWYCPGVGLAKRIIGDGSDRRVWELDTYDTDQ